MAEIGVHYAFIKHLHVLSVACSLALFAARWLGGCCGRRLGPCAQGCAAWAWPSTRCCSWPGWRCCWAMSAL